jgi:hypothetical protein
MDQPLPRWLRVILIFVALQAEELVLVMFVPSWVSLLVPFAATPLNARFIAALYIALGLGVLLSAFAEQYRAVRLILIGVALATALLFVMTLPRLPQINPFPTFWMLFYLIDPLLVLFTFWKLGWRDSPGSGKNPLALLWLSQCILFGAAGVVLLILPQTAIALWPWTMSVDLSQMYSMFFLTISVIALLAAREPRWPAVRYVAVMVGALALLVLVASSLHLDRFKPGPVTVIWFAFFALEALIFGGLVIRRGLRVPVQGVAA